MSRSHDEFPNTSSEFTSLRIDTTEFTTMRTQKSCRCQPRSSARFLHFVVNAVSRI